MEMLGEEKNAFKEYSRFEGRIGESDFVIHEPETRKGIGRRFLVIIILYIEIGMGKGRFLMDMAKIHPSVNYVGIEKYSSVLLRALQKMERGRKTLAQCAFCKNGCGNDRGRIWCGRGGQDIS